MGKSGHGVLEDFGLKLMQHTEIIYIGPESGFGSVGGVMIGKQEVVYHQRLNDAGYCFSVSSLPFLLCC